MFKKIEKKNFIYSFPSLGRPSNHESVPSFSPWPSNVSSSLHLVSLTGGPRMLALYSTTLNSTYVGLHRRVRVRRCHDSAPLMSPPIASPPKPQALLNSTRRALPHTTIASLLLERPSHAVRSELPQRCLTPKKAIVHVSNESRANLHACEEDHQVVAVLHMHVQVSD